MALENPYNIALASQARERLGLEDTRSSWERTTLGKVLHVMGTGERLSTKLLLEPFARGIKPDLNVPSGDAYAGDILRGLFDKDPANNSTLENLGYGAGGFLLGAAVDPLTYVGIGPALKGARLGGKAAQSFVRAEIPFTTKAVSLLPDAANQAIAGVGKTIQAGTAARTAVKAAQPVLGQLYPGIARVAEVLDRSATRFAQEFNFNIGVDSAVWQAWKKFTSAKLGAESEEVRKAVSRMDGPTRRFAQQLQDLYGIDKDEAAAKLEKIWADVTEQDRFVLDKEARLRLIGSNTATPQNLQELTDLPGFQRREIQTVIKHMGLPPTMGGPTGLLDTPLITELRTMKIRQKLANREVLRLQAERRGEAIKLMAHPDITYLARRIKPEVLDELNKRRERQWLAGGKIGKAPKKLDVNNVHQFFRKFRHVNTEVADQLLQQGVIDQSLHKNLMRSASKGGPLSSAASKRLDALLTPNKKTGVAALSADQFMDLVPPMTSTDVNTFININGWKGVFDPGEIDQFFVQDPRVIQAHRGIAERKSFLTHEFMEELKGKGLVQPVAHAPKDWMPVENIPSLQGYALDPGSSEWLARMAKLDEVTPQFWNQYFEGYSQALGWWKNWTLAIFPSFHSRNLVGALWNLYLHSPDPVSWGKDLFHTTQGYRALSAGKDYFIDVPKLGGGTHKVSFKTLYREARKQGLLDTSGFLSQASKPRLEGEINHVAMWGTGDPEDYLRRSGLFSRATGFSPPTAQEWKQIEAKMYLDPRSHNPFVQGGFKLASALDNRVRMSAAIQHLRAHGAVSGPKGLDFSEAFSFVKKTQFDYQDLSPSERYLWRNILPFYTWSRKNIPAQLGALVTEPDKIARFGGAMQGFTGWENPEEEKLLNDWMLANFPTRIRRGKDGRWQYFTMRNWLPLADIHDVMRPLEAATEGLTPFAKLPIELMANMNFFTRQKIDRLGASLMKGEVGETTTMLGHFEVPNKVAHVIRSGRLSNTLYDIIDNPQELSVMERIMKVLAGRTYPFNPEQGLYFLQRDLEDLRIAYQRALRSEARKGERADLERIQKRYIAKQQGMLQRRGLTS